MGAIEKYFIIITTIAFMGSTCSFQTFSYTYLKPFLFAGEEFFPQSKSASFTTKYLHSE